jgi:hypothetical protein
VTCYYAGGSAAGVLPAVTWSCAGWPGTVGFTVAAQLAAIAVAARWWRAGDAA